MSEMTENINTDSQVESIKPSLQKGKKLYWADQEVMFDNYTFSFE
jgi:hypothetical protein